MPEYTKEGHRTRVRDKCLKSGFASLNERDKLELLLFYAIPRIDTKKLAHELLDIFGNLAGVLDASMERLTQVRGIGENSALLIKLIPEIIKEYTEQSNISKPLDKSDAMCNFFKTSFAGKTNEEIQVACLDEKLCLTEVKTIMTGTSNVVCMDIRELAKFTYACDSENVVIAHNHPNGDTTPSDDDIKMTVDLYKKLKIVGINLLDHIIVAGGQAVSLRELGVFGMLK